MAHARSAPGSAAYTTATDLDALPPRDRQHHLAVIESARRTVRRLAPDDAEQLLDILGIPDPLPRRSQVA
jgi:hypothetical protein